MSHETPPTPPAPQKKGCLTGCLVAFVIVALVLGVAGVFGWRYYTANVRPALTTITDQIDGAMATEFNGTPADAPTDTCVVMDGDGERFSGWEPVACDEPHHAEITHLWDLAGGEFRGADAMHAEASPTCAEYFATFVGISHTESVFASAVLVPTEAAWAAGDRTAHCLVIPRDGGTTTGSAMHTAR